MRFQTNRGRWSSEFQPQGSFLFYPAGDMFAHAHSLVGRAKVLHRYSHPFWRLLTFYGNYLYSQLTGFLCCSLWVGRTFPPDRSRVKSSLCWLTKVYVSRLLEQCFRGMLSIGVAAGSAYARRAFH